MIGVCDITSDDLTSTQEHPVYYSKSEEKPLQDSMIRESNDDLKEKLNAMTKIYCE